VLDDDAGNAFEIAVERRDKLLRPALWVIAVNPSTSVKRAVTSRDSPLSLSSPGCSMIR